MSTPADVEVVLNDAPIAVTVDETVITALVDDATPDVQILTYQGIPGPAGTGDLASVFQQSVASATWSIPIPSSFLSAGKVPSVTVVDSSGNLVIGAVTYSASTITLAFGAAFSGTAYLN